MKVLVLILSSDQYPYTGFEAQWKRYMNLDPRFECYFYKCNANLKKPYDLCGNTLWIQSGENPQILTEKFYRALEFFESRFDEFDFISRPNASSLFLWDRYAAYLEGKSREKFVEGAIISWQSIRYPSGCGFTISIDMARALLRHRIPQIRMDDVTFGKVFEMEGIQLQNRTVFSGSIEKAKTTETIFHLRFKTELRVADVDAYGHAVSTLYGLEPYKVPVTFELEIEGQKVPFYRWSKKAIVSDYFMDASGLYFAKQANGWSARYHVFQRELVLLDLLKDKPWAPKVVYENGKDLVVTRMMGVPITAANAPPDVFDQAFQILRELKELDITHNDIKEGEIIVNPEGRLCLVDFGWSRIGGSLAAGKRLYNDRKPGGDIPDWNMIQILQSLLKRTVEVPEDLAHLNPVTVPVAAAAAATAVTTVATAPIQKASEGPKPYKDSKRPQGSQSEVPVVTETNGTLTVRGYQHFKIDKGSLLLESKKEKYLKLQGILKGVLPGSTTLADLGCSAGVISLLAAQAGFQRVFALDHDPEYLAVVDRCTAALSLQGVVKAQKYSFGDPVEPSDVVVMISLLHWVFSCTALYGNFASIREYLKTICKKTLLIEWIDPRDQAIQYLGHVRMNSACHTEPYTKENFLKAFGQPVDVIQMENGTRHLYVFHI